MQCNGACGCFLLQNWWMKKQFVEVNMEFLQATESVTTFSTIATATEGYETAAGMQICVCVYTQWSIWSVPMGRYTDPET
jgi:hypothetical protein